MKIQGSLMLVVAAVTFVTVATETTKRSSFGENDPQPTEGNRNVEPTQSGDQGGEEPRPTTDGNTDEKPRPTTDGNTDEEPKPTTDGDSDEGPRTTGDGDTTKEPKPTEDGATLNETRPTGDGVTPKQPRPTGDGITPKQPRPTGDGVPPKQPGPTEEGVTPKQPRATEDGVTPKQPRPTGDGISPKQPRPTGDGVTPKQPGPTEEGVTPKEPRPTEDGVTPKHPRPTGDGVTPKQPGPTEEGVTPKKPRATEDGVTPKQPRPTGDEVTPKQPGPTEEGVTPKEPRATDDGVTPKQPRPTGDGVTPKQPGPTEEGVTPKKPKSTESGGPRPTTESSTRPRSTVTSKPIRPAPVVKAQAQLKLEQEFTPELNDPESEEFKELASGFQNEMEGVMKQEYGEKFNRTEVNSFSAGSVLVDFTLILNGEPEQASYDDLASALESVIATASQEGGSLSDLGIVEGSVGVQEVEVFTQAPETNDGGESGGGNSQGLQCFTCFMSNDTEDKTCLEPQTAENVKHAVNRCNLGEKCWTYAFRRDDIYHNFTRACGPATCPDPGDDEELCMDTEVDGEIEMCSKCCSTDHCNDYDVRDVAIAFKQSIFMTLVISIFVHVFY